MKTRKMKMKKTIMKTTTMMLMKILLASKSVKFQTSTGEDSLWILHISHNDQTFNLLNKVSKLTTISIPGLKSKHFMEPSSANLVGANTFIGMDLVQDVGVELQSIQQ